MLSQPPHMDNNAAGGIFVSGFFEKFFRRGRP